MKCHARDGRVFCLTDDVLFADHHFVLVDDRIYKFSEYTFALPPSLIDELIGDVFFADWELKTDAPDQVRFGFNLDEEWTLHDASTFFIECSSNPVHFKLVAQTKAGGTSVPIIAGLPFVLSGLSACHRCIANLNIEFFDVGGFSLGSKMLALLPAKGGRHEADYQKLSMQFVAPYGAEQAEISVTYNKPVDPAVGLSSFIFLSRLSLTPIDSRSMTPEHLKNILALTEAGFGTGPVRCFSAALDVDYLSQRSADVVVAGQGGVTADATVILSRSELALPASATIEQIDANKLRIGVPADCKYAVFIDGLRVDPNLIHKLDNDEIVLSSAQLDGDYHRVQIRDATGCYVLCEDYILLPFQQTPWPVLQEHGGRSAPEFLSPGAGQRYRSLLAHLAAGAHALEPALFAQIEHAHGVVLRGFLHNRSFLPLRFPSQSDPMVSIVVPVHNKFEVTYFCLCALLFAHNESTFEVIVVDDGSGDRTKELPELVSNIVYVRNDEALGFVRACNEGARHARGEYLVFLNNDTEPAFRWLDELVASFKIFDKLGLAGSKLVYPDGRLQEAGGIVWKSGNPWNYGRLGNPFDPRYCYSREVDYVSGAALMVPKHLWTEVGGFSDEFAPAYFEDTDLAFKIRGTGHRTMLIATSVVYHFEGVTSGTDVSGGAKRYQEVNRPRFKRKWRADFHTHGEEGVSPDLEKDRGIVGRALFVDYTTPRTDIDAGSYAAVQEMRLLQRLGYKITFFPQNAAYLGDYFTALQRQGIEALHAPFYTWIGDVLERRGAEFDIIYITRYYVAQETIDLVRRYAPKAKILFCNADLHFLRELRSAILNKDQDKVANALKIRDEELAVMRRVDVTLSYNEVEHAVIMSHNLDSSRVMKLPWVEHVHELSRSFDERDRSMAFLGGFRHYPNVEAVEYFVASVMPLFKERMPDLVFNVFGSCLPAKLERLASKRVVIHGFVQDVAEVYDNCKVFVAPLLSGAGIKGKVLAALARGVPCVLSPTAAEGIGLRHGYDCMIAETPEQWAAAVIDLIEDRSLWERIGSAGQTLVREAFSEEKGIGMMRNILEALDLPVM
jgi:GT2 family glycosyltransferase/glycosyltransferase involved in cell wall biosynthesis